MDLADQIIHRAYLRRKLAAAYVDDDDEEEKSGSGFPWAAALLALVAGGAGAAALLYPSLVTGEEHNALTRTAETTADAIAARPNLYSAGGAVLGAGAGNRGVGLVHQQVTQAPNARSALQALQTTADPSDPAAVAKARIHRMYQRAVGADDPALSDMGLLRNIHKLTEPQLRRANPNMTPADVADVMRVHADTVKGSKLGRQSALAGKRLLGSGVGAAAGVFVPSLFETVLRGFAENGKTVRSPADKVVEVAEAAAKPAVPVTTPRTNNRPHTGG